MSTLDRCRSCGSNDLTVILDLGEQPLANALITLEQLDRPEDTYPLAVTLCRHCWLLQVTETVPPEVLFGRDYPYFSSFLPQLLAHSREHALELTASRQLGPQNLVVEIASNDGYLLKNFVAEGVPVLGIDPASGPAKAAQAIGVPTVQDFFSERLARRLREEGKAADVIIANNVLAHVAPINEFVAGIKVLLKDDGAAFFEFPYLLNLIDKCEFDTIYHEHVFYYSLIALRHLFERHGLYLNDARPLPIHGGSLRLAVSHRPGESDRLNALLREEQRRGVDGMDYYAAFGDRARQIGDDLRRLLTDLKRQGRRIVGYGAAAKGATLLNYARIGREMLDYVVDRNPHKVGRWMPGVRLPILPVERLVEDRPDFVLLLAWNFAGEIMRQQAEYAARGGRFIVPVPAPMIVDPAQSAGEESHYAVTA